MTETMTLTFDQDGTGHCLYGEMIDLQALGRLECRRASHIEFDAESQQWQVLSPDCKNILFSSPRRLDCQAWEQAHLLP
jgi:hypothetical protein